MSASHLSPFSLDELPWSAAANELKRTEKLGNLALTYALKFSRCMSKATAYIGSVSVRALELSQLI